MMGLCGAGPASGRLPFVIAALSATLGCGLVQVDGPVRITMYVHHHLAECVGQAIQPCLLVQEVGAGGLGYLYEGIEGFDWEWGYVQSLVVEVHDVPDPPADGSSVRYVLDRVIDRQRVAEGTEFGLVVTTAAGRVGEVSPGVYRVLASGRFQCADAAACEGLDEAIAAGDRVQLRLAHAGPPGDLMRLVSWQSCPTSAPPHPFRCR